MLCHAVGLQVKRIPDRFDGGSLQYAGLLLPLVAEEVRALVAEALEGISELPCARVDMELPRRHAEPGSASAPGATAVERAILSPAPDSKLEHDEQGLAVLKVRPTDLVMISSRPVQAPEDLSRSGLLFSLAIIESAERDSPDFHLSLCVGQELRTALDTPNRAWYLTPLGNVATPSRIWAALQHIGRGVAGTATQETCPLMQLVLHGPLSQLTHPLSEPYGSELGLGGEPGGSPEAVYRQAVQAYCLSSPLNPSQSAAVLNVAMAAHSGGSTGSRAGRVGVIRLVQGPPGTGKTSSTVRMLLVLAGSRRSTLVCAPTNVAVQEIAARLLKELPGSGLPGSGLPGSLAISDIVLQASEEKVDLDGPLAAILLPARAKRLQGALTGWPSKKLEVERLLAPTIVDRFLTKEAEAEVQRESAMDSGTNQRVGGDLPVGRNSSAAGISPAAFKAWVQRELGRLSGELEEMGCSLLSDLPRDLLLQGSLTSIQRSLQLLGKLLQQVAGMNDKRLLEACQEGPMEDGETPSAEVPEPDVALVGLGAVAALRSLWGRVLAALKSALLRHSVPPGLISEYGLQRLCLEKAKVVFCTVSSSGRGIMEVSVQSPGAWHHLGFGRLMVGASAAGRGFEYHCPVMCDG